METGLFEIQANHLKEFGQTRHDPAAREVVYALFGRADYANYDRDPDIARRDERNGNCSEFRERDLPSIRRLSSPGAFCV